MKLPKNYAFEGGHLFGLAIIHSREEPLRNNSTKI